MPFFSLSHKFYFFKGSSVSAGKYYLASSTTMKALPMTTPRHLPATLPLKSHVCQDFVKLSPCSPGSSFSPVSLGHLSSVRILSLLFSHGAILQRATELPNCQKNFMESFIYKQSFVSVSMDCTVWTAFDHTVQPLSVSSAGFSPFV